MTLKEYLKLQEIGSEIYGLASLDKPRRISHEESFDLKELSIPAGRMFATNARHLEFMKLSVAFLRAIKDGRVILGNWDMNGKVYGEVEILPPNR